MQNFILSTSILLQSLILYECSLVNAIHRRTQLDFPPGNEHSGDYSGIVEEPKPKLLDGIEYDNHEERFAELLSYVPLDAYNHERLGSLQFDLAEKTARTPSNLMDLPIPPTDEPYFVDPPLPQSPVKGIKSQSSEDNNTPNDYTSAPKITPNVEGNAHDTSSLTQSGVRLSFVGFPDPDEQENSTEQKSSIFGWFCNASQESYESCKIWFREKIFGRPIPLPKLIQMFKDNAASIPEDYNIKYGHGDELYDVGYSFAQKMKRGESPSKYLEQGATAFLYPNYIQSVL